MERQHYEVRQPHLVRQPHTVDAVSYEKTASHKWHSHIMESPHMMRKPLTMRQPLTLGQPLRERQPHRKRQPHRERKPQMVSQSYMVRSLHMVRQWQWGEVSYSEAKSYGKVVLYGESDCHQVDVRLVSALQDALLICFPSRQRREEFGSNLPHIHKPSSGTWFLGSPSFSDSAFTLRL